MAWKKIDNRIRILIENCVRTRHRSMFVVVGKKGRDQIVILHHMLSKAEVKARPSVLWCYKKELGFSTLSHLTSAGTETETENTVFEENNIVEIHSYCPKYKHRKKRMRQLKKRLQSSNLTVNEDDPFELFISSTNIRYCYYSETHNILGQTFGMAILQDFEAITPNLLARTIETVEGGGMVVILLQTLASLKQLYTMAMDVHARYQTEAHQDVVARFNERFILSLSACNTCLVVDDQLNVLPLLSSAYSIKPLPPKNMDDPKSPEEMELLQLKESFRDTPPVGALVDLCVTADQAKAVLKFVDALSEKTLRTTVSLTSARGRGKSAAMGFAIAGAVAFSYSNIFVTSPSPENLKTLFLMLFKGFDALGYEDHVDYEIIQSTNPQFNKAVVRVNIFKDHRQTVQYIHPSDADKLGQAELVVIDEAAAIPLPLVKSLLGPHLVFMASTVNGYEGTGRSLSLKLLSQLRQQSASMGSSDTKNPSATGRLLHEITLNESIRYGNGDPVEAWLNQLLCLDATVVPRLSSGCPEPQECQLYYISRDTLFSYHKAAEAFLQRLVGLLVASHYKNSPNDLLMMADAPAHHIFCLLPPVDSNIRTLPEILCVVQVCLEGQLSKDTVMHELSRGKRASGDLIPWTVSQQFQDKDFASLSGVRVVRIATHPDYQRMGYGLRALELLQQYYEGKIFVENEIPSDISRGELPENEEFQPRRSLPPLLLKLSEKRPVPVDYIGVSYGLTSDLLRFWKKAGFAPVYLRQTPNDLTGEHTCIMLKAIDSCSNTPSTWLREFWVDFRRRYVSLLSYQFRSLLPSVALSILNNKSVDETETKGLTKEELDFFITPYDMKRLESYTQNLSDYHLIVDLLPTVARFYFLGRLKDVSLSQVQSAILLCLGLQHKTVDELSSELELPATQILGLFNRTMRKITQVLSEVAELAVKATLVESQDISMEPTALSLSQELAEAENEIKLKQKIEMEKLKDMDFSQYAVKGSEQEWQNALQNSAKTLVSIKSIAKPAQNTMEGHKKRKKFDKEKKKKKKKHSDAL